MENRRDQQPRTESRTNAIEETKVSLRSGNYSRALDLARSAASELPNNPELAELEKLAQEGIKRKADADHLITESQDLFAQQKSAEAIQLLRQAYELDKNNSLARSILANALVEHAQSLLETEWWTSESLANEALKVNSAHPTAKTIHSLIVERKQTSSVDDWVSRARKLQSSGDLFAALGWVAEGLAVHPQDPKLLQIQDAIQRDQGARRRQARRSDLDDLRGMELQIDSTNDATAKQELAQRIQGIAAKYWTDGEILSIANRLLHRLGLAPQPGPAASPHSKAGAVIFHVPPPTSSRPPEPQPTSSAVVAKESPTPIAAKHNAAAVIVASEAPAIEIPSNKGSASSAGPEVAQVAAASVPAVEPMAPAKNASRPAQGTTSTKSDSATLIVACASTAAAILLLTAAFFFARKHAASIATTGPPSAGVSSNSGSVAPPSAASQPHSSSSDSVAAASVPAPTTPEPSPPAEESAADSANGTVPPAGRPPSEPERNSGTLLVVAGQNDAKVFLDGKPLRQLTQSGQLRLPDLKPKEYVVEVTKSGFENPPKQRISIRSGEEAKLIFTLHPQAGAPTPRVATLTIQGSAPGATVFVDQTPVGMVQPDGTLSVSSVSPGDHSIELRKELYKAKQFKKTFAAGANISIAGADAVLEPAPGELKITFTPSDANVALVKGDLLKIVSSGVPLNLTPGTYTLTARTAERFTRSGTVELTAGQTKTLNLALAPAGMSQWDDPAAWKQEGNSFVRKGGNFVLYGVVPVAGTLVFSAIPGKNHALQWVLNYIDTRNYVLFQLDDNNFYRTAIRNGEKTDQIIVPHRMEKKSIRMLQIRVSPTEVVHQIKNGDSWTVLDRWTQPGASLSRGKFGFYIPGSEQVALSSFAYYADLNTR